MYEAAFTAFPALETPRLTLRRFEERDAALALAFYGSPETLRYIPREHIESEEAARAHALKFRGMYDERSALWWVIETRDPVEAIGFGGLFMLDHTADSAEVGYGFLEAHWGQGYASEAVGAIIEYGFGPLGAHRIAGRVDPENPASARVLTKLGFQLEGRHREDAFARGRHWDSCTYARLATDPPLPKRQD